MKTVGNQIIAVPFTRIDPEKKTVYGYASTGRIDTYDSRFDPAWWSQAAVGYREKRTVSAMHMDVNGEPMQMTNREPMVVGTATMLEIDARGLWVGAEIRDAWAWEKVENGDYNGFSIAAVPFEYHEETVNGRTILVFTKYHLSDITIGYPAANLDAVFQLMERLAMDDSSPWDWDWKTDADAIIAQLGWEGLAKACLWQDPGKDAKTKEAYKLPVAKMKEGVLTMYWNGVRAAMARLLGGGGDIGIPDEDRKKLYKKLKSLYKKFGKEDIPEYRLDITDGGSGMNTFVKAVFDLVKRLSGKEPDATAVQEITALEGRLATEKDAQITQLGAAVTQLTERIAKLEKPAETTPVTPSATPDPKDAKITEIEGTVKGLTDRLAAVEQQAGKSQQPGETGLESRTEKKDVFTGLFTGE
jgi:uncharacterized coiled-coil protein SlyX